MANGHANKKSEYPLEIFSAILATILNRIWIGNRHGRHNFFAALAAANSYVRHPVIVREMRN
jgi:hypothetical protein